MKYSYFELGLTSLPDFVVLKLFGDWVPTGRDLRVGASATMSEYGLTGLIPIG
jgi:hypothetical protein